MPIPALVSAGVLSAVAVPIVVKVLVGLGIGFLTFSGISLLTDQALEVIQTNLSSLPADMAQIVAITKIDVYFTIVFSAYAIRLTLKGLDSSGVLRKIGFTGT